MASGVLQLNVLGGIHLMVEGRPVVVARPQVRMLLAIFAESGEKPVTADRLIDHVWGDRPPQDPSASLRVALSRLRTTLGPCSDALVSLPAGYLLRADTDVAMFETLRRSALDRDSPQEKVGLLRQADQLWTGDEPFGEFSDRPLLNEASVRLQLSRQQAKVSLASALREAGQAAEGLALVQQLHQADLGNEELTAMAALCLGDLGRKGAALGVISATRTHLRNELGVEPSAALAELEVEFLRGARDLTIGSEVIVDRRHEGRFVGREDEVEHLLEAATSGLRVVRAEPGAGKSRLLDECCELIVRKGFAVYRASASATARQPMQVLTELVTELAKSVSQADHSAALVASLIRLVPDLAPASDGVAPPESREALVGRCVEALAEHAPLGKAVLVIDDIQWIDRASAVVLGELIATRSCGLILASRLETMVHADALTQAAAAGEVVELGPLTRAECVEYVASRLRHGDSVATGAALHERCGGNPLFLSLVTDLLENGGLLEDGLPSNILVAVHERVSQLVPGARRLLEVGSIFPTEFEHKTVLELAGASLADLEAAVASGLLSASSNREGSRFAHGLVAEATYQLLSAGQRLDLHDEAARLLIDAGASAVEVAVHAGAAATIDPHRAADTYVLAAEEFADGFDWDLALQLSIRAHEVIEQFGVDRPSAVAASAIVRGSALRALGDPAGDTYLLQGVESAIDGEPLIAAKGLIGLCSHPRYDAPDGRRILAWVEQLLATELPPQVRAQLAAAASTLVATSSKQERGRELYREALEVAEALGDRDTIVDVLLRLNLGAPGPADFALRQRGTGRLRELANADPDCLWEAAFLEFGCGLILNDEELVTKNLVEMRELTPQLRMKRRDFGLSFCEVAYQKFHGNLDAADELIDQTVAAARSFYSESWVVLSLSALLAGLREAQGRAGELLPFVDTEAASDQSQISWRAIAAAGAAATGDLQRTKRELACFHECDFELPQDFTYSAVLSLLVEPVELVDDRVAAARLLDLAEPLAGRMLWNGLVTHRSADEVIARYKAVLT